MLHIDRKFICEDECFIPGELVNNYEDPLNYNIYFAKKQPMSDNTYTLYWKYQNKNIIKKCQPVNTKFCSIAKILTVISVHLIYTKYMSSPEAPSLASASRIQIAMIKYDLDIFRYRDLYKIPIIYLILPSFVLIFLDI